jgi:hypothetical protein
MYDKEEFVRIVGYDCELSSLMVDLRSRLHGGQARRFWVFVKIWGMENALQ